MLVILNPAPVLEALHAVLNVDYIKPSDDPEIYTLAATISYNVMHEEVWCLRHQDSPSSWPKLFFCKCHRWARGGASPFGG